jgi:hypothetical protein
MHSAQTKMIMSAKPIWNASPTIVRTRHAGSAHLISVVSISQLLSRQVFLLLEDDSLTSMIDCYKQRC